MTETVKKSFNEMVSESPVPVLVDVYSDTCGPCIALKPVLKELKNRMGDDLKIIKINGPRNMSFMQEYQIQAFPTLMLFKEGKIVWADMGYRPLDALEKTVRKHI